jgi:FkbM family methyltransferase
MPAPPTAEAIIQDGLALHRAGQLAQAGALYRQVLAGDPANFDATHLLGMLALQSGQAPDAIELMRRAIAIRPDDATARSNLGLAYRATGRLDDAEASLRESVCLRPEWDRSHANLGLVLRDRGQHEAAIRELSRAVELNPANDEALTNLGNLYRETRRFEAAEERYRAALSLRPDRPGIWVNLAALAHDRGRWGDAETFLRSAIGHGDEAAETRGHLGFALLQQGRLDDAESACREALARRANYPDALVNLAAVLKAKGDLDGAEAMNRSAIAADPAHVAGHVNLGTILRERGDAAAAEACFQRAHALDPASAAARYNLGTMLLLRGDYRNGFDLVESRFEAFPGHYGDGTAARFVGDAGRRWRGEAVRGKRVVVWSEQGHGDNLMMLRYLPLLKERGAARVALVCGSELAGIAAGMEAIDDVVAGAAAEALADYDLHCPALSLPFCFRTEVATVPNAIPYVAIPRSHSDAWSLRLADVAGLRVGLAWAGSPSLRDDARRSLPLATLAPLFDMDGVRFVSLQKGPAAQEAAQWRCSLVDVMDACKDFTDTAALIDNLDLVVTVDTAVAHLAGAMGKPVWLLNRAGSEWRWGTEGTRSAWYPSMRIFRQAQPLAWTPVVTEVRAALAALASGEPGTGGEAVCAIRRSGTEDSGSPDVDTTKKSDRQVHGLDPAGFNELALCRSGPMLYNKNDIFVGGSLQAYGEFSASEQMLFRQMVREGMLVVEVGANIGAHTVELSRCVGAFGQVHAFEPQRLVFQALCANLALNQCTNVFAEQAALGNAPGSIMVPPVDPGSRTNFGGIALGEFPGGERVAVRTLDSLDLPMCHLLKVDVEGMEIPVLQGAERTIDMYRPLMYVENDRVESSEALLTMIFAMGYDAYWHLAAMFNPDNFAGQTVNLFPNIASINVLCIPRESKLTINGLRRIASPRERWNEPAG